MRSARADDLGTDPAFATNAQRINAAAKLSAKLQPYCRANTTAEWHTLLAGAGVPCGAAHT
jgi:CoA:oxalate CoA-transferase